MYPWPRPRPFLPQNSTSPPPLNVVARRRLIERLNRVRLQVAGVTIISAPLAWHDHPGPRPVEQRRGRELAEQGIREAVYVAAGQ